MNRSVRTAGAFAAYLLIAFVFAWPIPRVLRTDLPAPADGDTAVYVWNVWMFHHEIAAHGRSPLETDHILVPGSPVPLVFHNYTIFADLLAFPLVRSLGVVGAFNVVHLVQPALAALAMFLLAQHVSRRTAASWLAGIAFGFSPFVLARGLGHFSLASAAPLPLFTLFALRAMETRKPRYGVGAGAAMAWAAVCDPYYAIYCLLVALAIILPAFFNLIEADTAGPVRHALSHAAIVVSLASAALALVIVLTGGWAFRLGGRTISVRGLYTPVLLVTIGLVGWVLLRSRVRRRQNAPLTPREFMGITCSGAVACVALLSPMLPEILRTILAGRSPASPVFWRSSAPGVDLLSFVLPNPMSPVLGTASQRWLQALPNGFVENTASLPLVALITIAAAWLRSRFVPPRFWIGFGVVFALLALGPFLHIAGVNTYVPGPWALVRYLPIVGLARMPGRLVVLVTMAVALILSLAVAQILSSQKHPAALTVLLSAALLIELSPLPRHLYRASVPNVYEVIRTDPRDVSVLELPVGIEDGLTSVGAFSPAAEFFQTFHGKRIFGGYISRVPSEIVDAQTRDPLLGALFTLSEGGKPPAHLERQALARVPGGLASSESPGYVVIETGRTSDSLRRLAIRAFDLEPVAADGGRELYRSRQR